MIFFTVIFSAALLAGGWLVECWILRLWDAYLRKTGYEEEEDGD